jgi:hypothetical protein
MASARLRTATCRLALAPVLVAALAQSAEALLQSPPDATARPGAILVQVTDTSINPLPAEVVLPGLALGVRLTEEGTLLVVNVPEGVYIVQVRHSGYASDWRVIRVIRDTVRVDFTLAPATGRKGRGASGRIGQTSLATARLLYFLARSTSISGGSFLTRAEIERRRARNMSALLRGVRDVRVDRTSSGWIALRSAEALRETCPSGMLVFVDAVPLSAPDTLTASPPSVAGGGTAPDRAQRTGWSPTARFRWVGPRARDLVPVMMGPTDAPQNASGERAQANVDRVRLSSVVAVEVYPALAGVPPEFLLPGAECGVVVIWTAEG